MEYSESLCEICGRKSDGKHFNVETCRACAAFFRRSKTNHSLYTCKFNNLYCNSQNQRKFCKQCRYKKCLKLGMGKEKKESKPLEKVVTLYEKRIIYQVIDPKSGKVSRFIDVSAVTKRSRDILERHLLKEPVTHLNSLEKMVFALKSLRASQNPHPVIITSMVFRDFFYLWERNMVRCAEWLMYSEEFRRLPEHERWEVFKLVWAVWRRVERNTMSAKIFGQKCYDEKLLLLSNDVAGRHDDFHLDLSTIYNMPHESAKTMFSESVTSYYEFLVKPQLDLKLTTTEVTFILCQIVWNYAGRRLQGQTQAAADRFLSEISNNLHDYYGSWKEENYAARLAKIMKIVNAVLAIQAKQETLMNLVALFDVHSIKFSDFSFFCV